MISNLDKIYGNFLNPYYIYAPRWINSSAGIKALHYLCHSLNMVGANSYLILSEGMHDNKCRINPNLLTPILTQEVADAHFKKKMNPIVIYSETVPGNPLNSPNVVRYLMNFAGALGGPSKFNSNEFIIAFSQSIASHYAKVNSLPAPEVLFLPPIDPREFNKNTHKENFQLVYAGKYRSFIGKPFKVGNLSSVEIFRDGLNMQSRSEVIELLSKASVLYSFENSSIVSEAILSGTPAYFVPNKFLGEVIAKTELGPGGLADADTPEAISIAAQSIDIGINQYYQKTEDYLVSLENFVLATQKKFSESVQKNLKVPDYSSLINKHRLSLAVQILKNQGPLVLIRVIYHFAARRLSFRYLIHQDKSSSKSGVSK